MEKGAGTEDMAEGSHRHTENLRPEVSIHSDLPNSHEEAFWTDAYQDTPFLESRDPGEQLPLPKTILLVAEDGSDAAVRASLVARPLGDRHWFWTVRLGETTYIARDTVSEDVGGCGFEMEPSARSEVRRFFRVLKSIFHSLSHDFGCIRLQRVLVQIW